MDFKIIALPWDSQFFGVKVGKIDFSKIKDNISFSSLEKFINQNYFRLVYIYFDINQEPISFSRNVDLKLVDIQFQLNMQIPKNALCEYELITNENLIDHTNIDDLYKIANELTPVSRFSYDPRINKEKVIELYHKIIENSLNSTFGDGLILDTGNNKMVKGFFVLKTDRKIGKELLIGVKKSFRGKDVGKILFNKSISYWKDKGVKEISTVVSAKNLNSLNFHLKLGYKISKIIRVYHFWSKSLNYGQ